MAILKHIASKKSSYLGAEQYLTFQHNEHTMKPVLDADGYMIPREKYIIEGVLCEPGTYAHECRKLNRKFNKNTKDSEIKFHHYIVSFDPKDIENGLTMEKAFSLVKEFALKHFPGHQMLVCAHEDGHHKSNNIHVHIVMNSLRMLDTEQLPCNTRVCDSRAGYKHHCSKSFLKYLQKDLEQLCLDQGYHQVDLNKAQQKVSNKEHYVEAHLQKEDSAKNTELSELRKAIDYAREHSESFQEFQKMLLKKYGVAVKESRGNWSYLPAGKQKPIRGRRLGKNYEKEFVLNTMGISGVMLSFMIAQMPQREKYGKLIDLNQEKFKDNESYLQWAQVHNLQVQAKALSYLTENNLLTGTKLEDDLKICEERYAQADESVKKLSSKVKKLNREIRLLATFYQTKKTYTGYAKSGFSKEYYQANVKLIEAHKQAKKEVDQIYGTAIPDVKALKKDKQMAWDELEESIEKKAEYKFALGELQRLQTAKQKILAAAGMSSVRIQKNEER